MDFFLGQKWICGYHCFGHKRCLVTNLKWKVAWGAILTWIQSYLLKSSCHVNHRKPSRWTLRYTRDAYLALSSSLFWMMTLSLQVKLNLSFKMRPHERFVSNFVASPAQDENRNCGHSELATRQINRSCGHPLALQCDKTWKSRITWQSKEKTLMWPRLYADISTPPTFQLEYDCDNDYEFSLLGMCSRFG